MNSPEHLRKDINLLFWICGIALLLGFFNFEGRQSKETVIQGQCETALWWRYGEVINILKNMEVKIDSLSSSIKAHTEIPHLYGNKKPIYKVKPLL